MKAKNLIEILHSGQKRKNGEPYTSHPYAVSNILEESGVTDKTVLDAAILHDILEDNPKISREYLKHKFGEKIATLVDLISKDPTWNTSYCKMKSNLVHMEIEWMNHLEVVLIKMADRLHNLQTIGGFAKRKQKEYLEETKECLMPLFQEVLKRNHLGHLKKIMETLYKNLTTEIKKVEKHIKP